MHAVPSLFEHLQDRDNSELLQPLLPTHFSSITFSSPNWLWAVAGILVAGLVLIGWAYRNSHGAVSWVCPVLKSAALVALALCLLEPLWLGQRARPGANLFVILADNSQGMQVKAMGAEKTRGDLLRDTLDPQQSPWLDQLAEDFDLRRYSFDARVQSLSGFDELSFQGRASAMAAALNTVSERFRNRPLAGVLLVTDGNATDMRGVSDLKGWPKIYPVVPGGDNPVKDLGVLQVRATQTAFEDAPVTVQADLAVGGLRGESVRGLLLDPAGNVAGEQVQRVRKDNEQLAFRFQLRPQGQGVLFYRFQARLTDEQPVSFADSNVTAEATLANNASIVAIDRGRGSHRILYVSGRPNWEFKFLNRAVDEDPQLQLVALIRVARREPKFNFLGRSGETSNPLFRGFGEQSPEEIERYDQSVLVRLNTRDEQELRGGFPRTAEELFSYEAVVLDDVEAEFFTPDQAQLLHRFVSERGGGLLMLGGMESFHSGNYHRTPIGEMLPVYLDRASTPSSNAVRVDFTREGWLQAWARLRDNEVDERTRLKTMPAFHVFNPVREIKPGASAILSAVDAEGNAHPGLVVQRFGHGRTAALAIGDLWRWGFQSAELRQDMDKAWRQLMRWLVSETPARTELLAEPTPEDPAGGFTLKVRAREPDFRPLDAAKVVIEVQPSIAPDGSVVETNTARLLAQPSAAEPGLYQASYIPRSAGGYHAIAYITNSLGEEVGRPATGWSSDLAADEFRSLSPNVGLLEEIARKTGGEMVQTKNLRKFVDDLPHRAAPVMEAWSFPLWHTPVLFGFALACLLGEWGFRRWKGLP